MNTCPPAISIKKLETLIYDLNSKRSEVKYSSGQEHTIKYWRETFGNLNMFIPSQEFLEKITSHLRSESFQYDEIRILRLKEEATYYAALKLKDDSQNSWTYDIIVASQNLTIHASREQGAMFSVREMLNNKTEFGRVISEFELPADRNYQD